MDTETYTFAVRRKPRDFATTGVMFEAVAVIDACDRHLVESHVWNVVSHPSRHSVRHYLHALIDGKTLPLHRLIMGDPAGMEIDHVNGDGLDNRRCNLRPATHGQNQANRPPRRGKRFKGVNFHKNIKRWQAHIGIPGGKLKALGYFDSEEDAARAYDRAALEAHGDFAWLNYPAPDRVQRVP